MVSRILKWGNSLAIRIPKVFADEMNVAENTSIQMVLKEGALQITPITETGWDLVDLLAGVKAENLHDEWETDKPVGKEQW
ncbi:MAG: AbrB/MazE/SpoVT family DNA-binding domain-containing protein [Candidatus Aminicenantes bacterium]|nr:AbrB/MazE/SpoVT family DNA-binding domain-containing protein [Candidatus Aminicenantes bacterium]